jgi:hypothetical protein
MASATRTRRIALAVLVIGTVAGCGQPEGFALHGASVVVQTDAPFARQPDFPARIESTLDVALQYWGGSWTDLEGASIELTGDPRVRCGGAWTLGCWDGDIRLTTRDPGIGTFDCVEQTILVHEVGHAVLGDPLHLDPRWMRLEPVQNALEGRPGYTTSGVVECVLFPSVWRHPLGKP